MLMPTPASLSTLRWNSSAPAAPPKKRDRRHAHDQIIRRACHHAPHGVDHVAADDRGAGHEGLVLTALEFGVKMRL